MKLTTTTQVSVDGVMQGNGPSQVEHMAGFERDGWAMGHFDSEAMTFVEQLYQRADAFLFGRWTYDFFAGYWGVMDPGSGRRDEPARHPGGRRPGHAAVPRQRPGHGAGPGRTASLPDGRNAAGLPPVRPPAVRSPAEQPQEMIRDSVPRFRDL